MIFKPCTVVPSDIGYGDDYACALAHDLFCEPALNPTVSLNPSLNPNGTSESNANPNPIPNPKNLMLTSFEVD